MLVVVVIVVVIVVVVAVVFETLVRNLCFKRHMPLVFPKPEPTQSQQYRCWYHVYPNNIISGYTVLYSCPFA